MSPSEPAWSRWLCGDHADRARFRDMHARFRDAHWFGLAVGGTCSLSAYWYGWELLLLVALASVTMAGALGLGARFRRPELVGAVAFGLLQLNLAASVSLSGGGRSPLLPLMVVPVFTQAVCFRPAVIRAGVAVAGLLALVAVLLGDAHPPEVAAPPLVHLVAYLALLASLSLAAFYLADSDRVARDEARVDPLTGLGNRKALAQRFRDARAQALAVDAPVSVVLCDLDHFKDVNDRHGHERGDEVLVALASLLRSSSRTFDLVYRLGGEEFLVLLPGLDAVRAAQVAEQLRADLEGAELAGLPVTMSLGVATGTRRELDLAGLVAAADTALYGAKRAGRNRVEVAPRIPGPREQSLADTAPVTRGRPRASRR